MRLAEWLWPHVTFYDKQREVIRSVWQNDETYVPAGNQLGKDFVAGFIALAYFLTHDFVRVVTTSVADHHLRVLWDEINAYIRTSRVPLTVEDGGPLRVNHHDIRKRYGSSEGQEKSYLIGRVSAKGEGLQGHHAPHSLLIVDEASGAEEIVYDMASAWAKRMLIIGNPLPCNNFFYQGVKAGDLLAQ